MSSTNKTQNLQLSQYIGSDKPTYLGDYNSDMLKIDTAVKNNSDDISSINSEINTLEAQTQSAQSTANTANTNAGNAQTTANSANTTAISALTKANENESDISSIFNMLNLNNIENFVMADITASGASNITLDTRTSITVAKNDDGSLAKIYGEIHYTASASGWGYFDFNTSLRPAQEITITPAGIAGNANDISSISITISTNGRVRLTVWNNGNTAIRNLMLMPCLYWITDFGDTILPSN